MAAARMDRPCGQKCLAVTFKLPAVEGQRKAAAAASAAAAVMVAPPPLLDEQWSTLAPSPLLGTQYRGVS